MVQLNGFVKIHRKLVRWGWYTDNVVKGVFLHLLLTANFKNAKWMGRTLKKGQLITTYGRLAADLGFSVQQVRTAIKKLESTGEIMLETTNKYTLISVINWDEYQCFDEEAATRKLTNKKNAKNPADKPFFESDFRQINTYSNNQATSRFDEQTVNNSKNIEKFNTQINTQFNTQINTQSNEQNQPKNPANKPFFDNDTKKATSTPTRKSTSTSTHTPTIHQQTNNKQITNKQQQRKKSKYLKDTYSDRENKEKKESAASAPLEADPRSRETEAEKADRLRREALRR